MMGTDHTEQGSASAETGLRAVLWYRNSRYRSGATTHHRSHPVRNASQTDLNREFKEPRYTNWQWFLIALFLLTAVDYFYLRSNSG